MIKKIKIEDVTSSICYAELKEWIMSVSIISAPEKVVRDAVDLYNKMVSFYSSFLAASHIDYSNYLSFKDKLEQYLFDKTALAGTLLYIAHLNYNPQFYSIISEKALEHLLPWESFSIERLFKQEDSSQTENPISTIHTKESTVPTMEIEYVLPEFFNGKLRNSEAATKQFMELLRKCCESIGKRNGKTWGHVREALINIGFIDAYSPKMTLAQTIAEICPNTTKSSVNQSMKRYYGKRDSVTDANIIADIAKQFQPVLDAIKP